MRRWTGIVLISATAYLLSACGSGSVSAPDIRPSTPSAAAPSTPPGSSSSPIDSPAPSASTDPTAAAAPVPTAADPTTAPPVVVSSSAADIGGTPGQPGTAGTPADGGGSAANPVDGTSSRWFDTFCSAMSTAASTRDALDSVNVGDAASEQSTLLGLLITMGDTFTSAASTLSGLGAPPATGGDTWPATVQSSLASTAQQLTDTATALAAADPNDTTAQTTATDTLITHTDQAQQLAQSIADTDLSDTQRAALGQLPSCRGVIG